MLSRKDIQIIARCGCPILDRKVVNSGNRLRAYMGVDEGDVKNITDIGACVSLLKYNKIEGMILFSELSRHRIRSVSSFIKVRRIEPVMVLRADKDGEDDEDKDMRWSNQQHQHMETCKNCPLLLAVLVGQFLDSFYHNLTNEELKHVHEYNFDHPDALDTEKLLFSIDKLKHGQAVDIPNYDFKSYKNSVLEIPPLC
ncbi:hypothetical protein ACFX13_009610 [Malus domestica]